MEHIGNESSERRPGSDRISNGLKLLEDFGGLDRKLGKLAAGLLLFVTSIFPAFMQFSLYWIKAR